MVSTRTPRGTRRSRSSALAQADPDNEAEVLREHRLFHMNCAALLVQVNDPQRVAEDLPEMLKRPPCEQVHWVELVYHFFRHWHYWNPDFVDAMGANPEGGTSDRSETSGLKKCNTALERVGQYSALVGCLQRRLAPPGLHVQLRLGLRHRLQG